jgi:hypothetical protein
VGGDARAAEDGWRLAAQLALQGEPADAGQLLLLVAAKLRDREFAQLAQLLIDYPALSEAHASGGGGGGGGAWELHGDGGGRVWFSGPGGQVAWALPQGAQLAPPRMPPPPS